MSHALTLPQRHALVKLTLHLIDQENARVIVPPYEARSGFWFGGGNLARAGDGALWLCGRYRNYGDSRTGLEAGTRGMECALFRSDDNGATFTKVKSWSKADLSGNGDVLSIEGTALHQRADGSWELFISMEKARRYPPEVAAYQKPGTGVWSIDRITGATPDTLATETLQTVLENYDEPGYLHMKDPVVYDNTAGDTMLIFCTHPISWASSNTGVATRPAGDGTFTLQTWQMVERGPIWDVAATRVTDRLAIPRAGHFADAPPLSVYFYDGAEGMRQLEQNPRAFARPRGYSCEEISGALWGVDADFPQTERLSWVQPLFVSPHGTGSSRYVSTLVTPEGIYATWEQSQPDESQPLVLNFVPMHDVERILAEST